MFKKLLAAVGALALGIGLVAVVAAPAQAHDSTISASCQSGVSLNLTYFNPDGTNTLKVIVDGVTVADQDFSETLSQTYPFTSARASHTYQIIVHAWDQQQFSFDTGVVTVGGCETAITPTPPSSTNAVCVSTGTVGGGSYTIPAPQTGVEYQRFDAVSASWISVGAGTYAASAGSVIKIQAVASTGYKLTGTTSWNLEIVAPVAANCVVPTAPTASPAVCTSTPGSATVASYTIPSPAAGTDLFLQGDSTPLVPGTVAVTTFPTTVVIVAKAASGFIFPTGTTTSWTFPFTSAGACLGDSVAVAPTFTPAVCTATPGHSTDNTYTIHATPGAHFQVKIGSGAFLDVLPGTYSVGTEATSVTIVALPDAHYQLSGQTTFPHDFPAAPACLTTVVPNAGSTAAVCDTANPGQQSSGSYTLDAVTGVIYSVSKNGGAYQVTTAGTHQVTNGTDIKVLAAGDTANGYRVDGTPAWHFTFASPGDCLVATAAGSVTFVDAICDAAHPGTSTPGNYTIVAGEHVSYQVSVSSIDNGAYKPVSVGGHTAAADDIVTVKVVPDTGYTISPAIVPADFTHTFLGAGLCLEDAKWVKPAPTSESCVPDGSAGGGLGQLGGSVSSNKLTPAFITIPATTGVQYSIDGVVHAAGDVVLAAGTYTVTAAALTGYQLAADYPVGGWTEVLVSAEPCGDLPTHPLVMPTATPDPATCFAGGSYTLGNDLNDPAAITWTANGARVAPGTYQVSAAGGTVVIHAEANGPTYGLEQAAQQDWTFTFATPGTCDLKTLALTGSTPVGWIVLGYLMLISGLVLVAIRYARRRPQQE